MRQWVINGLTWQEDLTIINNTTADKSQRMQELESKNNVGFGQGMGSAGWYSPSAPGFNPYSSHATIPFMIPLPEGLSAEDLKQAHVEATMEEEMLNGQEESKT